MLTASTDHSVKVCAIFFFNLSHLLPLTSDYPKKLWDLASKSLLTTFQLPHAVDCIAWDATERFFFAASGDGSIHQVNLFRTRIDKTRGRVAEAVGGGGVSDILSIAEDDSDASKRHLLSVGCATPSLPYRPSSRIIQPYPTFHLENPSHLCPFRSPELCYLRGPPQGTCTCTTCPRISSSALSMRTQVLGLPSLS